MSALQKKLRCAVYTRKSTEEGLDQEFNSLDAQREACVSFIASQAGLGWRVVADPYDDGGISGGTMDRPALQRLLQDVRDRKIDVVVVYKIDRLTRSLMDFSKIVEVFDANDVSFVSVTQQFNTTTSMGRLTLNVLLSFAQFEREVTAERIRDKIAASRKKGIWMGGSVPFGYQAIDKKLIIDPEAAKKVRSIFSRYLELKSVFLLLEELNSGACDADGSSASNSQKRTFYSRGMLYHLLSNPVYIGKARHRDMVYNGEHQAIIDDETFASAQAILKAQAPHRKSRNRSQSLHLLTGLLFDETGDRLSPVFTTKGERRFRYYVSHRLEIGRRNDPTGWRLPAEDLEQTVLYQLGLILRDEVRLSEWGNTVSPSAHIETVIAKAAQLRKALKTASHVECAKMLKALLRSIRIGPGEMVLEINPHAVLEVSHCTDERQHDGQEQQQSVTITVPFTLRRRGFESKLVLEGSSGRQQPDDNLIELLAKAHVLLGMLTDGSGRTIADVANAADIHVADVSRILPLAFLAPKVTDAILRGRQPVELTARSLARDDLPMLWSDQRQQFAV
ncbi:site-specific recombinase [Mesorhizobium sp. Root157]|uniref:recombinase family protein n=1 Tax=Mesorhizobium sp. Root157 TaxID=1736477 RepID=UPI0006F91438|nr:recombinase family protein [Mesorhizobium sp. Root157]KQZ96025.1 site-specific recombinase [Mesorhizobium sp. Root157]